MIPMSTSRQFQAREWTRNATPVRPGNQRALALPASSAWRTGDAPQNRQFIAIGDLTLEAGGVLPDVNVAYQTWGTLNEAKDNAVLILHALTGDSHVTRNLNPRTSRAALPTDSEETGTPSSTDAPGSDPSTAADTTFPLSSTDAPGWWEDMVGPGAPIDTNKYFVVAPNVLGGCQGTTGPATDAPDGKPWGSQFPVITIRDQVACEIDFSLALGITHWSFIAGASMGGLRVVEWGIMGPERGISVGSLSIIAASAQATGDQIAWAHPQIAAIEADPHFNSGDYYDAAPGEGPTTGLGIARQIAHNTYRSARELDQRFGRIPQHAEDPMYGGRFAVQSYLDHHADKLARRFDANSYLVLTQAMLTHDLGRDRGGVADALRSIKCPTLVVAVDTDRLFLPHESHKMSALIPHAGPTQTLNSDFGHDGFLIEFDQLGPIVTKFLRRHARTR